MERIDGNKIAAEIKGELAAEIARRASRGEKIPHLVAVLVGDDAASETYVSAKVKACQAIGMKSTGLRLPAGITTDRLLEVIDNLNADDDVDGYIIQLPCGTSPGRKCCRGSTRRKTSTASIPSTWGK